MKHPGLALQIHTLRRLAKACRDAESIPDDRSRGEIMSFLIDRLEQEVEALADELQGLA